MLPIHNMVAVQIFSMLRWWIARCMLFAPFVGFTLNVSHLTYLIRENLCGFAADRESFPVNSGILYTTAKVFPLKSFAVYGERLHYWRV